MTTEKKNLLIIYDDDIIILVQHIYHISEEKTWITTSKLFTLF